MKENKKNERLMARISQMKYPWKSHITFVFIQLVQFFLLINFDNVTKFY